MNLAPLPAETSALLVIDMQNAFCHPEGTLGISGVDVEPARRTYGPIRNLVEAFKDAGLPVIWTRQVHLEHDRSRSRKALAAHTAKRARVSALAGSWDAAIVDELADLADDPTFIVTKHRFGAFYETRLRSLLDMLGVRALFVTGVTTNACVETTLREAYLRDYDAVAVTDAIASVRPEWEATAHAVWAQYLAVLATSGEVLEWLGEATAPGALRLHHLLVKVSNLEKAERFYVDVLGLSVRDRQEFRGGGRLTVTHQGVGLVEGGQGERGALEHLCLAARGVDGIAERAKGAGFRIVRGPEPGPYGYTVYIADPDGNEVELFEERA
jgi:ureidoacrylate peracid hydrolase